MSVPYPTVFKGNVSVEPGLDTGIYGTGTILVSVAPTTDFQVATKKYVDDAIAGLDWKEACLLKTTSALSTSVTPAGAKVGKTLTNAGVQVALTVDGTAVSVGDRILVDSDGTGGVVGVTNVDNGVYTVTVVGDGVTNWVLTRATDADGSPAGEVDNGMTVLITSGVTAAGTVWTLVSAIDPVDVDVDPQVFVQSGAGASPTWANVLSTGNVSGANDVIISSGQVLHGADAAAAGALTLRGGNASGAAATGGTASLTAGSAGLDGLGGTAILSGSASNPSVGTDAQPAIVTANGGAIDGTGGALTLVAGNSSNQAGDIGGAITMSAGDTTSATGTGGAITITSGIGSVLNSSGGDINIIGGGSVGAGTGGSISLTGGSTVGGTNGEINLNSPVNIATTALLDMPTAQAPAAVTSLIRVTGLTGVPTVAAPGEGQIAYDAAGNDLYVHVGGGTWSRILSTGKPPTLAEVLVAGNSTGGTAIINSLGDVTIDDNLVVTGTVDQQGAISNSTGTVTINDDLAVNGSTTLGDASGDTVTSNAASWTYANATTTTLLDNSAIAWQIGATGATNMLVFNTSNGAETLDVNAPIDMPTAQAPASVNDLIRVTGVTGPPTSSPPGEGQIAYDEAGGDLYIHEGGGTWTVLRSATNDPSLAEVLAVGNDTQGTAIINSLGDVTVGDNLVVTGTTAVNATSNQLVLGTTNTTTLSAPAPGAPITLTFPSTNSDTLVARTTVDTLTNKTLIDASTSFADDVDTSKIMQFQLSGITTATTRTLTVPNASGTLVLEDFAAMLTNKTMTSNTNNLIARELWIGSGSGSVSTYAAAAPTAGQVLTATSATTATWQDTQDTGITSLNGLTAATQTFATGTSGTNFNISSVGSVHTFNIPDASATARGLVTTGVQTLAGAKTFSSAVTVSPTTNQLVLGSTNTTTLSAPAPGAPITLTLPSTSSDTLVARTTVDTLTNKTLIDASTSFADDGDTSKLMQFQLSGITTATTRTLTVPNASGTIVLNDNTATLTNKTLLDASTFIADDVDTSKRMQFQVSGVTTATTRTLTVPNASGTIVLNDNAATLTNKTLTSSTNNVIARALFVNSGAGSVSTFAAAVPTAGQVLTATSGTTATWQAPAATGVTSINALTAAAQTLVTGTAGTDFAIVSAGSTHTFNLPDASATARGVVTTGAQTLAGAKTFSSVLNVSPTSNQLVLGTTNTTTLSAPAPGAPITLTLPSSSSDTLVARTTTDTLTNKTLIDASTSFADDGDTSKIMQFQLSGITTATTRTLTVPNASGTLVLEDFAATLTNKTMTSNTNNLIARALWIGTGSGSVSTYAAAAPTAGQVLTATSGTTATWQTPTAGGITTLNGLTAAAQTFATGTTGTDFNIASAGSTHTFNIPDASASARGLVTTGAQTFGGAKTFDTAITVTPTINQIVLGTTNTTTLHAPAPAGNITLDFPSTTDTLVGRATTDTLTNKTITDSTNDVAANSLKSATTLVDVSAATAPTSGQVLTATSGTAATWQNPATPATPTLAQVLTAGNSTDGTSIINSLGDVTIGDNLVVTGSLDARGAIFNSVGTLLLNDVVSITGATTISGTLTANGNVVIGNTSGDTLTIDAGITTYVNTNTETHNNTYDLVLVDNNAAAWEIGSTGALNMMTFDTTNTAETIDINARFEMPSGEAVSTTKHFKPTGTSGVPTGNPGGEGHIAYDETGNALYLHTGAGTWVALSSGTPTLAQVLASGNSTDGTSIINSLGDVTVDDNLVVTGNVNVNGNTVIGNSLVDSLTVNAGTSSYGTHTETHVGTYDLVLVDNNAAAWEIGSTGALDMMTFDTTNSAETIDINARFEMPSGEAVSTTKHFKPTGTSGVPTGNPGGEGHIAYDETGNDLYLHTGGGTWTVLSTGGGGITSLNTLTATTQTFATGTTGTDFNIASAGSTHTFNIPDASASARGLVTTGTQTFGGNKSFAGVIGYSTERISAAGGGAPVSPSMTVDTVFITTTNGTGANATGTLPDGTIDGRTIKLVFVAKGGTANYALTVTSGIDADGGTLSTLTFSKIGHTAELVWGATEGNWYIIGGAGVGVA